MSLYLSLFLYSTSLYDRGNRLKVIVSLEGFSCKCEILKLQFWKWLSGKFALRTIRFCFASKVQRCVFQIQSHFPSIPKISSFIFWTFSILSHVTDCSNSLVVWELYISLHLPTLPCLGSNGPVGPIYLPHLCIMDKRCKSQHSTVSSNSNVLDTEKSIENVVFSFLGRYLVESCEWAHSGHDDTAAQFSSSWVELLQTILG